MSGSGRGVRAPRCVCVRGGGAVSEHLRPQRCLWGENSRKFSLHPKRKEGRLFLSPLFDHRPLFSQRRSSDKFIYTEMLGN